MMASQSVCAKSWKRKANYGSSSHLDEWRRRETNINSALLSRLSPLKGVLTPPKMSTAKIAYVTKSSAELDDTGEPYTGEKEKKKMSICVQWGTMCWQCVYLHKLPFLTWRSGQRHMWMVTSQTLALTLREHSSSVEHSLWEWTINPLILLDDWLVTLKCALCWTVSESSSVSFADAAESFVKSTFVWFARDTVKSHATRALIMHSNNTGARCITVHSSHWYGWKSENYSHSRSERLFYISHRQCHWYTGYPVCGLKSLPCTFKVYAK